MKHWFDPARLRKLRQKQEVTFTPLFLHRPLAILFLIPTADIPWMTPNRITLVSVVMRMVVAVLLWPAEWGGPVLSTAELWGVILLWHFGTVLDAVDGALARYRGLSSVFGRMIDKVSDRIVTLCLFLPLAARAWLETHDPHMFLLAMTYLTTSGAASLSKWISLGLETQLQGTAEKVKDDYENEAPSRTPGEWARYLLKGLAAAVIFTEMDLPLWGSIALLTGRTDLLFWAFGVAGSAYALAVVVRRTFMLYRAERTLAASRAKSSTALSNP